MHTSVAVIGGGLAGLTAARLLTEATIDHQLFEARDRLGGRILSVDGFDLGPSWFWPDTQPELAALTRELGLSAFPQHSTGDLLVERSRQEPPLQVGGFRQEPESMRLAGGTGALVTALAAELPTARRHLDHVLTRAELTPEGIELAFRTSADQTANVRAQQLIVALPPRLAAATISFTPVLEDSIHDRWGATPTWMAAHAKLFAIYEQSFWRARGLSGTARSMVGPLVEIHDATTHAGAPALFGFVGIGAVQRASVGEQALVRACLTQLTRLFGDDAATPRATLFKDWTADPLTSAGSDRGPQEHPVATMQPWVTGPWAERMSLGGSETSRTEPGYLAGAVEAARRAVAEVTARLGVQ
ncbi:MAG: FAD-dependent oxidoreductase [Myxococcales bacterium]|nr:FAD-dependent oxidoreductase [Myxococcales bacterium]